MTVTVVVKGSGLVESNGGLSGLRIIERTYELEDGVEFGQFVGPSLVSDMVAHRESNLRIPREARYTWTVKRVEGADADLYDDWASEFANSEVGAKDLDKDEILLYWLQRTQDEEIIELLK